MHTKSHRKNDIVFTYFYQCLAADKNYVKTYAKKWLKTIAFFSVINY